jgi:hypothetical protein
VLYNGTAHFVFTNYKPRWWVNQSSVGGRGGNIKLQCSGSSFAAVASGHTATANGARIGITAVNDPSRAATAAFDKVTCHRLLVRSFTTLFRGTETSEARGAQVRFACSDTGNTDIGRRRQHVANAQELYFDNISIKVCTCIGPLGKGMAS